MAPLVQGLRHHLRRRLGDEARPGGCADLVRHHTQFLALGGQPQHRAQKVVAPRGEDPAGAQDEVIRGDGGDRLFAGELAVAVGVDRTGRIVFFVGAVLAAVEYVVGRVMQQQGAAAPGLLREQPRRDGVDPLGQLGLGLGAINRRVGGGIDDHVGAQRGHCAAQGLGVGKIHVVARPSDDAAEGHQRADEFPAHLPAGARYENGGHGRSPRPPSHGRERRRLAALPVVGWSRLVPRRGGFARAARRRVMDTAPRRGKSPRGCPSPRAWAVPSTAR